MSVSELSPLEQAKKKAEEARAKGIKPKKANEILRRGPEMVTLGIYLPRTTVVALKRLAFEEETSVSAIIDELVVPRIKEGPRPKEPEYPTFDL
ncbi:ParB-like dsDNA partitioning protein [Mycobacterium phage miche]|nr:ParB-like dsDNA partitioning protein [Mycobacterium phage Roksolana]WRQ08663.1 ParB-like dsDNA partitioning protein [Mycobacterium phage miche]